jgi:type II secretory pathway component PulF
MLVPLIPGVFFLVIEEYEFRLEKRGLLGFLLLFVSDFITDWLWVKLCMILLGGGLMLYDIASKRNLPDAELEE